MGAFTLYKCTMTSQEFFMDHPEYIHDKIRKLSSVAPLTKFGYISACRPPRITGRPHSFYAWRMVILRGRLIQIHTSFPSVFLC